MKIKSLLIQILAVSSIAIGCASGALTSTFGILDLTANGGINPNTGVAWAVGDQFRLAFYTSGTISATSADIAVYNAFATAQANLSILGDGTITTSTGWTAMVSTPTVNVRTNTGTSTMTIPAIGGAGVPVFAMDGKTAIARNNADIWDGWSNAYTVGNVTVRTGTVHYSPFLNQNGTGDSGVNHGVEVWTGTNPGGLTHSTQAVGNGGNVQWGSTNANNSNRPWQRGNAAPSQLRPIYVISPVLTVIPEPSSALLAGIGLLGLLIRRR